jgi:APA family basic amino acid/polyamine antiporter
VVFGTVFVAAIYMLNSVGIMAIIPSQELAHENAPYVRAAQILFGGKWDILIALMFCIACFGTLNAWVLTSGQIAYGAAKDKLLPDIFGRVNKNNAPYFSIILSFLGTIPILIITLDKSLISQVNAVLDFSVTAFLFIYLSCMLSFLKLKIGNKKQRMICILAIMFCLWVLYSISLLNLAISLLFVISGIPIYIWCKRKNEYFQ